MPRTATELITSTIHEFLNWNPKGKSLDDERRCAAIAGELRFEFRNTYHGHAPRDLAVKLDDGHVVVTCVVDGGPIMVRAPLPRATMQAPPSHTPEDPDQLEHMELGGGGEDGAL